MATALNSAGYERLKVIGQRHGRVTTGDVARTLPLASLSAQDLTAIIERLEDDGIEVEVDVSLLMPRRAPVDREHGVGVVDMANPAAPAISVPGARPATAEEIAGMGFARQPDAPGRHHHAPTLKRGGVDMLPLLSIGAVTLVMLVAFS